MYKWSITCMYFIVLLFAAVFAYTHPGGTDSNGGHYNRETGEYHYHNGPNTDEVDETIEPAMQYPIEDFSQDIAYKVVRIIDGDTVLISIDGEDTRVRLIGINTPERDEANGKDATTFIQNLLKGESVYLKYGTERKDFYGRTLAYLYRAPDGLFVNLEIVRQGYGKLETRFTFDHFDLFHNYNERAKFTEKGLWAKKENDYHHADLNRDGIVNILDLVIVANAFGESN